MATAGASRGSGPERAFVDPLPDAGRVVLSREEERHLLRVRRVAAGDEVVLFDGRGRTRLARVSVEGDRAALDVVGPYPDREPGRRVEVACALPGAGRADDLVFALAECGVARLVPLTAERSGADARRAAARRERHERLAREAAKVNGRSRLMEVAPPASPEEAVRGSAGRAVVLDPDPALPLLPEALPRAGPVLLLVGPEGGFTDAELAATRRAGAAAAALGACVLRVETAAVVAAGIALAVRPSPEGDGP